jgi:hypothetical protein
MSFAGGSDQGPGMSDSPPEPAEPAEPAGVPAAPAAASALFGTIEPRTLSLGTAIEVAFKAIAKPAFVGPILVMSVIVNAILEIALGPDLRSLGLTPGTRPTLEDLNRILGAAGVSFIVTFLGGILVAIYGTVWAVTASVGPFPTIGETLRLAGRRWTGVGGVSLLVGCISIGLVVVAVVGIVVLTRFSEAIAFGVAVGLVIVFVWLIARLAMATWLAADGRGAIASIREAWRISEGQVLRIVGWSFAYGLLIALLAGALGLALGRLPLIGAGIAQGLSLALTYGAAVTLFRRTEAGAAPLAAQPSVPPGSDTSVG